MTSLSLPQLRSESIVGTAATADTFILIETPEPWIKPALLSEGVPESLRQVVKSLLGPTSGVRVHLIANEQTPTQRQRRLLIFQRPDASLTGGARQGLRRGLIGEYTAWEIQVDDPEEMAPALVEFLNASPQSKRLPQAPFNRSTQRHLMICTHASHNECCGVYGYPFYQAAIAKIKQMGLTHQVQPWQISHIGGHRFAPTLIDFPQGRYYGNLDKAALRCLLKQHGAIRPVLSTYRGWSLLPKPLQILEAELLKQHGWAWLKGRVSGRLLHQNKKNNQYCIELWFESADQTLFCYTAEIQDNVIQNYQLKPDLNPIQSIG